MRIQQDFLRWTRSTWIRDYLADRLRMGITSHKQRAIVGVLLLLPLYVFALWIGGLGSDRQVNPGRETVLAAQVEPILTVIPADNILHTPSSLQDSATKTVSANDHLDEGFLEEYDRFVSQEDRASTEPASSALDSSAALTSKLMLALFVVLGGVYGIQWVVKRLGGGRIASLPRQGATSLQVKESKDLATGQKLHLVQFGDDLLLLGATSQNITLLARYPAEDTVTDFSEHLATTIRQEAVGATDDIGERAMNAVDDLPSLKESLARLRQSQARSMREPYA